ncbi:CPBP family intramembrane glutamic endopeptidase [Streptomyces sp. NPDC001514]
MSTFVRVQEGGASLEAVQEPPANAQLIAAPAGVSYPRLARTELHRWWRPLVAMLVAVVVWWLFLTPAVDRVAQVALLAGVEPAAGGDTMFAEPLWDFAALTLVLALMIPAVVIAARFVQRRPAGTLSSVTGRLRWRWLLVCLGVAVAAVVLVFGLAVAFDAVAGPGASEPTPPVVWAGWPAFLTAAAVVVLLVPFQAAAEEYVFRGWIPQIFGCYLRTPWVGLIVAGGLFALGHGIGTPWGFADLLLFSLVLGVLVNRTGGLEAAIAYHVANNVFVLLLSVMFVGGIGSALRVNISEAPWVILAATAIVMPLYAVAVLRLSRRFRIERTTPEPAPRQAEPVPVAAV